MKRTLILFILLTIASLVFSKNLKIVSDSLSQNNMDKTFKQYSIEQFYKNLSIFGGAFSSDESKLLVTSNLSGIFNAYEINIEDASIIPLTHSTDESIFGIDYVPGTKKILYSSDKGGNEISHIYLLNEDGTSKDLTPDEKEKASFYDWSSDKNSMYYISNKRNPQFFDFYKMNIGTWKAEMIYQNDEGYNVGAISDDENFLALSKSITTSESKLYLMDRSKNKTIEISDSLIPGNYNVSDFSNDGNNLFYITNLGEEFSYLAKYHIETGKSEIVFQSNWDVMYSYDSENEKYKVTAINEDGKNKIIIKNNISGDNVKFPEIPDGDISSVNISNSENLMTLRVSTSKAPSNVYVYNFETNELKKVTNTLNEEINPDDLVSAEVVRYKSFDGLEIPSIFYKPLNASEENKVPALISVHGGPGGQSRIGYSALIQFLVNHGYAILEVNNRGSSGYGKTFFKMDNLNHGDKDLMDCVYGKKYLQTLDYIDKDNIGIIGGSYGGFMTMAAMTFQPDEFKVGIDIFGVTNWLRTLTSIPVYWESFRKALYSEMGDPATDSVRLYNISPLFHAHKIKNPVMVLQGANDPRVLQAESDEIVAAIKKNNVPVEYLVFPDEGHGFVKKENEIKGYGDILKFLDKYLKNSSD